jgi:isochorismate synthase EntC
MDTAPGRSPFLCYGTADTSLIACGRRSSIALTGHTSLDATWAGIDKFLQAHSGDYVVGFIGFDPSNELGCDVTAPRQKIDLFVPTTVIECSASGHVVTRGDFKAHTPRGNETSLQARMLDPAAFDHQEGKKTYRQAVGKIIERIQCGSLERVTLARRVDVDRPIDLAATFLSDGSRHACARNFYFGNEYIRFAGQSPELLAEGSRHCFRTHKLSGTYRTTDERPVEALTRLFLADQRIQAEHYSSIAAIEKSLQMLGFVDATRFQVMTLPGLLHGWSKFITRPERQEQTASCLRAVFPYGMQPVQEGLELLRRYERFPRGPYYGLVGYVKPGGDFSFTQVLRTAFADSSSNYLVAGAAITRHSTPELEVAETCTKLSAIPIFEMTHEAAQYSGVY